MSISEVNIKANQEKTDIVLFSKDKNVIRGIFDPEYKLSQYKMINNEIFAFEVLT